MFSIILKKEDEAKSLFNNIKKFFNRTKFYLYFEKSFECNYVKVVVEDISKVNWEEVKTILYKTSNNVIFSNDIINFPRGLFKEVETESYSNLLTINTLESIFKLSNISCEDIKATLIDVRGIYIDYARMMVKYCGKLKVYTDRFDIYENFAEDMLDELGAIVIVVNEFINFEDNNLIVCPDIKVYNFNNIINVPIVSCNAPLDYNKNIYYSFRADTPQKFRDNMLDNIDQHKFQAAIYSVCKSKYFKNIIANRCFYKNKEISVNELASRIFSIDNDMKL